ncbi:Leucine-Rich Repeat And Immunoglobulin-Like Domain-Containing Nogo Receptor-Interacting Protein 4 [Manis pentadactyla]|nr:Leucine-Rich Repeat And Immunoglobulin-Like Domain-Containing Nogo Receptor-Interacting Protein 4 [Manis pentadactyla]
MQALWSTRLEAPGGPYGLLWSSVERSSAGSELGLSFFGTNITSFASIPADDLSGFWKVYYDSFEDSLDETKNYRYQDIEGG